ncbi:MAG: peptidylprolyl isomerase [Halobacteriovoraceae bacterium]|nr:peptidylprolyl isomerase [Halobacteriovoraceae bacterium]
MGELKSVESIHLKMVTNYGDITIELWPKKAPLTVKNFMRYVNEKKYDGTVFHRVIKKFVLQGGGLDENLTAKETYLPIKNEAENMLKNDYGTLSMARTQEINSATNQFFINLNDNQSLNHFNNTDRYGYAVFGKVNEVSYQTLKEIENVDVTNKGMYRDVPKSPVKILKIEKI